MQMVAPEQQLETNMERTNEKPVELTTKELDTATGGMVPRFPTHLTPPNHIPTPANPYTLNHPLPLR